MVLSPVGPPERRWFAVAALSLRAPKRSGTQLRARCLPSRGTSWAGADNAALELHGYGAGGGRAVAGSLNNEEGSNKPALRSSVRANKGLLPTASLCSPSLPPATARLFPLHSPLC